MTRSSYCPPVSPSYGGLFGAWLEGMSAAASGSVDRAPIDFHTGEPVIGDVLGGRAPGGDLALTRRWWRPAGVC